MFYTYRTTSDKLADGLNHIEGESGDQIVKIAHVGGRDWLIVARKTPIAKTQKELQGEYFDSLRPDPGQIWTATIKGDQ